MEIVVLRSYFHTSCWSAVDLKRDQTTPCQGIAQALNSYLKAFPGTFRVLYRPCSSVRKISLLLVAALGRNAVQEDVTRSKGNSELIGQVNKNVVLLACNKR